MAISDGCQQRGKWEYRRPQSHCARIYDFGFTARMISDSVKLGSRIFSQGKLSREIERETEREQPSERERPRERETDKEKKEKRIYEG